MIRYSLIFGCSSTRILQLVQGEKEKARKAGFWGWIGKIVTAP
jgi:hypothetical protein